MALAKVGSSIISCHSGNHFCRR